MRHAELFVLFYSSFSKWSTIMKYFHNNTFLRLFMNAEWSQIPQPIKNSNMVIQFFSFSVVHDFVGNSHLYLTCNTKMAKFQIPVNMDENVKFLVKSSVGKIGEKPEAAIFGAPHLMEKVPLNLSRVCFVLQPILNQAGLPQGPSDQKVVVVTVDNCDTSVALRFGHMIGNYTCSAQGSQSGSKK